jgi:hypothetical protein
MSFRNRLTLFFVLIVIVPMIAVGFVLFHLIATNESGKADAKLGAPSVHRRGSSLMQISSADRVQATGAGVPTPQRHLPVWPFWTAGAVCEAVCGPLGIEPPIFRRRVDFFTKSRAFDITRARQELGFAPRVGLREGIRRTLDWYRTEGWL